MQSKGVMSSSLPGCAFEPMTKAFSDFFARMVVESNSDMVGVSGVLALRVEVSRVRKARSLRPRQRQDDKLKQRTSAMV